MPHYGGDIALHIEAETCELVSVGRELTFKEERKGIIGDQKVDDRAAAAESSAVRHRHHCV